MVERHDNNPTPSLSLLPGLLLTGVLVLVRVPIMDQIELFLVPKIHSELSSRTHGVTVIGVGSLSF